MNVVGREDLWRGIKIVDHAPMRLFDSAEEALAQGHLVIRPRSPAQRLAADLRSAGVSRTRYDAMQRHHFPLVFKNRRQCLDFLREVVELKRTLGIDDVRMKMLGTSTTFYSGPHKPGHYFDRPRADFEPSDLDIQLVSPSLHAILGDLGVRVNPTYGTYGADTKILKDGSLGQGYYDVLPELQAFEKRWSRLLRRPVGIKIPASAVDPKVGEGWDLP